MMPLKANSMSMGERIVLVVLSTVLPQVLLGPGCVALGE